jgi:hypothetical protein
MLFTGAPCYRYRPNAQATGKWSMSFYQGLQAEVVPFHFTNEGEGGRDRVAVELGADSARALIDRIVAALASGEAAHAIPAPAVPVAAE